MPLLKYVLTPLAKRVLIPSGTDTVIQKKTFGSGMAALITSNEEMNDLMKIVSDLLIKRVSGAIKNEEKGHKVRFLGMLSGH